MKPEYWYKAAEELSATDGVMAGIITRYDGECLESRGDAFFSLARSIVGQQVSVKAADAIWRKFEGAVDEIIPQSILDTDDDKLREAGLSRQKVVYLKDLSHKFTAGEIKEDNFADMNDAEIAAELCKVKGIGKWTAEMFLIFHMLRPNIFPIADLGLQKAIRIHYLDRPDGELTDELLIELSDRWTPWRSVATWYLWRSLDPVPVEY